TSNSRLAGLYLLLNWPRGQHLFRCHHFPISQPWLQSPNPWLKLCPRDLSRDLICPRQQEAQIIRRGRGFENWPLPISLNNPSIPREVQSIRRCGPTIQSSSPSPTNASSSLHQGHIGSCSGHNGEVADISLLSRGPTNNLRARRYIYSRETGTCN